MSKLEFREESGELAVYENGRNVTKGERLKRLADWLNNLYVASHHLDEKVAESYTEKRWPEIMDLERDPERDGELQVSGHVKGNINVEGAS